MSANSPIRLESKVATQSEPLTRKNHIALLLFLVFGYEWLISGIDKVASGKFVSGLHTNMQDAIQNGAYPTYAHVLKSYCLAHCTFLGYGIELLEVLLGVVFIGAAIQGWITRNHRGSLRIAALALLIGAIFSLNILAYTGGQWFVSTDDPFDEGIPIDLIMVVLQAGLFVSVWMQLRVSRKQFTK